MALLLWDKKSDGNIYLRLENLGGEIVLTAVEQDGTWRKSILTIAPEGIRLCKFVQGIGICTDPEYEDSVHVIRE